MTFRLSMLTVWIVAVFGAALAGPLAAAVPVAMQATVTVYDNDTEERFRGTAFALSDGRTVVTNAHVVKGAQSVWLEAWDGSRTSAVVVAIDQQHDLALLRPERPLAGTLSPGAAPEIGAPVLAVGAPLGTGLAITAGIVSATDRQIDPEEPVRYLQHSAPVNPGSSGGPLLNQAGEVVGINTRIADGSRYFVGIAYAVPVADVLRFLANPNRPATVKPGLRVRPITRRIADALGLEPGRGVLVDHVTADGPSARAGVQPGDILLRLNGRDVTRPGDIALILARATPGDEPHENPPGARTVTVLRAGSELALAVPANPVTAPLAAMPGQPVIENQSYGFAQMGIGIAPDGEILDTEQGGTGFFAGLTPGDHVVAVNGQPVADMPGDWPTHLRFDRAALLLLRLSDGSTRHVLLDPWAKTPKLRPTNGANVLDQAVVSFE